MPLVGVVEVVEMTDRFCPDIRKEWLDTIDKAVDAFFDQYVVKIETPHGLITLIIDPSMPDNQIKVISL